MCYNINGFTIWSIFYEDFCNLIFDVIIIVAASASPLPSFSNMCFHIKDDNYVIFKIQLIMREMEKIGQNRKVI